MSDTTETVDRPVVVGVNGSDGSLAAVRYGAKEAAHFGCGLRIVHVAPNYLAGEGLMPGAASVGIREFEALGQEILERAAKEAIASLPPQRVTTELALGSRSNGLLQAAMSARLVVVGDDRTPMLARLAVGGFIGSVAARTPVPLVSVPADWSDLAAPERRVVLALKDPQRIPIELLRAGFEIAQEHGTALEIAHVWELPPAYGALMSALTMYEQWQTMIERFVEKVVGPVVEEFPDVTYSTSSWYGQPAQILRERGKNAQLLLLARRAHGFPLGHFGATGRALLREATCPVEVLPMAEKADQ
jgi:nucleotide-binding universal stress UspA family protein